MESIEIKSNAKINLSIDVLKKFENGYHEVDMIMQEICLSDKIKIKKRRDMNIFINSNSNNIPLDNGNIAYKACTYMIDKFCLEHGFDIYIDKKIPVEAGLAGGSTNAATVIKAIAKLENIDLSYENAMGLESKNIISRTDIAQKIGCDVSFFLEGKSARATGLGECIQPIENNLDYNIIIVKPEFSIPTKWVYQNLKLDEIDRRPDNDRIVEALKTSNFKLLAQKSSNVLETVLYSKYPDIFKIKTELLKLGADMSMMCGSGSAVFGIFSDSQLSNKSFIKLKEKYNMVFETKPVL